jgi:hypothetical protein
VIYNPSSMRCQTRSRGGLGKLIDDEMLHTTVACGSPDEVAAHIRDRVDSISDRICLYQPRPIAVESLAEIVDALGY